MALVWNEPNHKGPASRRRPDTLATKIIQQTDFHCNDHDRKNWILTNGLERSSITSFVPMVNRGEELPNGYALDVRLIASLGGATTDEVSATLTNVRQRMESLQEFHPGYGAGEFQAVLVEQHHYREAANPAIENLATKYSLSDLIDEPDQVLAVAEEVSNAIGAKDRSLDSHEMQLMVRYSVSVVSEEEAIEVIKAFDACDKQYPSPTFGI